MDITFDPNKDQTNRKKHGISLAEAASFDWDTALVWLDDRFKYNEPRECALGVIGERVYYVAFVERDGSRRIISLRKANMREVKHYVEQT